MRNNVAHYWAAANLDGEDVPDLVKYTGNGKRSNFYWSGSEIFSYGRHFCIAKVMESPAGKGRGVLFTRRNYSMTTSRHIGEVRQALRGRDSVPVLEVEDPARGPYEKDEREYYEKAAKRAFEDAARARGNAEWKLSAAHRVVEEGNALAEFMGWEWRIQAPANLDEIKAQVKAATLAKAKQTKEAEARFNAAKAEWSSIWPRLADEWRARVESPGKGWASDLVKKYRESGKLQDLETLLRLSADGQTVETSRRASVPVADVVKVWPVLSKVLPNGQGYQRGALHAFKLGHFTLDSIDNEGTFSIGCHRISLNEVNRLGAALGLPPLSLTQKGA